MTTQQQTSFQANGILTSELHLPARGNFFMTHHNVLLFVLLSGTTMPATTMFQYNKRFKGCCSYDTKGERRAGRKTNCLLTHFGTFHTRSLCLNVTLSASRGYQDAVSKVPTQDHEAVAVVKGNYITYI